MAEFRGYLHMDNYSGYYELLESIIVVSRRANVRRYFDEAVAKFPLEKRYME